MNYLSPTRRFGCLCFFGAMAGFSLAQTRVIGQFDVMDAMEKGRLNIKTNDIMQITAPQGTALLFVESDWEASDALRNTSGTTGWGVWADAESASNLTVCGGVFVVKPEARNVRMAVLTGEHVVRLGNRQQGGSSGRWDSIGPAEGTRIFVNGVESAPMLEGVDQVVSFILPSSMPLSSTVVLGDPGLPRDWRRTFEGEAKAIILLGGDTGGVGEAVEEMTLRGIENALALRFKIAGVRPATSAERGAAWASGFDAKGVWRTLFLVK